MKKLLTLILGIIVISLLKIQAQVASFQWLKSNSVTAQNCPIAGGGESIEIDNSGNIYVSGGANFVTPSPNYFVVGGGCPNISKFDNNGLLKWTMSFSAPTSMQIKLDSQGNIYAMGNFSGTMDMDPGPNVYNLVSSFVTFFIAKYDTAGHFNWAHSFGSNSSNYGYAFGIGTDNAGNFVIGGNIYGTVDMDPSANSTILSSPGSFAPSGFFAKYNSAGNLIFARNLRNVTGDSYIQALDVLQNNEILISGWFYNKVDFDPSGATYNLSTANGPNDIAGFFARYDSNGNFILAKAMKGNISYGASCLDITGDLNSIYIAGSFVDTIDFDPGTTKKNIISDSNLDHDGFAAKYDIMGNLQWVKKISSGYFPPQNGTDECYSIEPDQNGNVYVYGKLRGNLSVYISKYNSAGVLLFQHKDFIIGTPGEIYIDGNSNLLVTGITETPAGPGSYGNDFDFSPATAAVYNPQNTRTPYIAKYRECPTCSTPVAFLSDITSNSARVNWSIIDCAYKYQIQYRVQGTTTWSNVNPLDPVITKKISGLSPATIYEYRIRTRCDNSAYSPYSSIQNFTTNTLRIGDKETDQNISSLIVKPNPVRDVLNITFETDAQTLNYQIINTAGQVVLKDVLNVQDETVNKSIDISKLQNGIYLLQVFNGNNIASSKFVKE